MKILILMWVVPLMFSFSASDTNPTSETYTLTNTTNLAKHGCESQCGDLIVPYPFGIVGINSNSNCSIGYGFDVYCNTSSDPPRASIRETDNTTIKHISDSTLQISNIVATKCYFKNGSISSFKDILLDYMDFPYTFSKVNKFTVIGCNDYSWLSSAKKFTFVHSACMSYCEIREDIVAHQCSGNGCCQSSIPPDLSYYRARLHTIGELDFMSPYIRPFNPCTYAFVGEENVFNFNGVKDLEDTFLSEKIEANVPIVLDWAIGNLSCTQAEARDDYACLANSKCVDSTRETGGYRCICKEGYEGNPYLFPGCQDIDECKDKDRFPCYGTCINTPGNYTCKCKPRYSGDAKIRNGCRHKPFKTLLFSLGTGSILLAMLIVLTLSHFTAKKRKLVKLREKFFEQNGGMLLEDKLKTNGGIGVGSMKIFHARELEEATDKYAEDKILGRGGNGIVYKGNLPDKGVVAIKKSQRLDQEQREQFINEMVILTQINHQNVVQLLGCCLETDVPLLVYEFVSNDTLDHHIHYRTSGVGRLSWGNRLRIAHESAGALAYLHTDTRMSIIHRDVKSANILLDDNYTAKISDFGASRLVPLGHDQVTTLVQGTLGYLDPEYFHTGQLTDKSDVYSFGVVLAELLTGQRPLSVERCLEERNLATHFVKAMEENKLLDILERQVVHEATDEQLKATGDLTYRCLNQVGRSRPSMKEVTMELETLRKFNKHPWFSQDNYNETSSLMIESEPNDLYTVPLMVNSDTFGEYNSSTTGMKDMMVQVQSPR